MQFTNYTKLHSHLIQVWIKRLKDGDIIPQERRTDFLAQVFWNIHDIIAVHTRLRDALNKRQKAYAVVERIGDILLDAVPHFGPFVSYGAHQLYGKYEFEKEKNSNPAFAQFVEVCRDYFFDNTATYQVIRLDNGATTGIKETGIECVPHETDHPVGAISLAPQCCFETHTRR